MNISGSWSATFWNVFFRLEDNEQLVTFYDRCWNTKQIILKQIPDAALVLQKYDSYPKFYEVTNWREWCWNKTILIILWSIWLARNFSKHWLIAFSLLFLFDGNVKCTLTWSLHMYLMLDSDFKPLWRSR